MRINLVFIFSSTLYFTTDVYGFDFVDIDKLMQEHGKSNMITLILEKSSGSVTIYKEDSMISFAGRPAEEFVNICSLNHDFTKYFPSIAEADRALGGKGEYVAKHPRIKQLPSSCPGTSTKTEDKFIYPGGRPDTYEYGYSSGYPYYTSPYSDSYDSSVGNSRHTPGTDVHVRGHYKSDGSYVQPYTRSRPH